MTELSLSDLNAVDITILVIFGISILIGFGRGLVSEIISLLTIIAAFVVAILFTNELATFFTSSDAVHNIATHSSSVAGSNTDKPITYVALGISFAILFLATIVVGSIIKAFLNLIFNMSGAGFGNRILGGLFGAVRGYLLCFALIFLIQLSPFSKQPWWEESTYVPYFHPQMIWLGEKISPVLKDLQSTFNAQMEELKKNKEEMKKESSEATSEKPPVVEKSEEKTETTTTTVIPIEEKQ